MNTEPEVVAIVSPDIAAWLDPTGTLRKAGLMKEATDHEAQFTINTITRKETP